MRFFRSSHSQSEKWHTDIDTHLEKSGLQPDDLHKHNYQEQPWSQMRQSTDRYLARKRGTKAPDRRDEILRKLILDHERKDVAIIACGHAMSAGAMKNLLLSKDLTDLQDMSGLKTFLHCIRAASLVNQVVSDEEGFRAMMLLSCKMREVEGLSDLEHLIHLLFETMSLSVTSVGIQAIISTKVKHLATELGAMKAGRRWSQAHSAVTWLSRFENTESKSSEDDLKVTTILDKDFPFWRAWARWKPNIDRIANWCKLDDQQHEAFGHILDLDGPDFISNGKTYGQSIASQLQPKKNPEFHRPLHLNGSTTIECPETAHRLLSLLENITTRPNDQGLFLYLLSGPDINEKSLVILEKLSSGDFGTLYVTVSEAYSLHGATPEVQNKAVRRLLKQLNKEKSRELRDILAIDFTDLVLALIRQERENVFDLIRESGGNLFKEIQSPPEFLSFRSYQSLYADLQQASWLLPFLEGSMPGLMEDWPTVEELRTLHYIYINLDNFQNTPIHAKDSVVELMRCYILENPGSLNGGSRALTKSLIRFWQTVHDETRRLIALALIPDAGAFTNIRCACIDQLASLSETFVRRFWHMIGDESEDSCVEMAKLLASTSMTLDMRRWRPVLYGLIIRQEDKLLEYVIKELPLQEYVQFLENLEVLYGTSMKWDASHSPAVLKPGLLAWAKKLLLSADLLEPLRNQLLCVEPIRCLYLEAVDKPRVQELAEKFFRVLRKSTRAREADILPIRATILDHLEWSRKNHVNIYNALVALNSLSNDGFGICKRIHDLYNSGPSHFVTLAIMEAWLSDPSLSKSDARALKTIFIWKQPDGWLESKGLPMTADQLDSEYAELLDEARRLAALRASLKSVDLPGITELLARIEIEDCTPLEDALASLPSEVLNAVEIVGEKEVEILFPLTHFTKLQRTALGIGSAQSFILLLELCEHKSYKDRFCVHLDGESMSDNSNRTVQLLEADASPWINKCRLGSEDLKSCKNRDSVPFKHHFSQWLSRRLTGTRLGRDFTSLSELHSTITHYLNHIGRACTGCEQPHTVALHRPTVCPSTKCKADIQRLAPKFRLADLIQDPLSFDLLLTSVYAAALTGNSTLLPNCPIKDPKTIVSLLDQFPPIKTLLSAGEEKWQILFTLSIGLPSSNLINYLLTTYRSFLVSASSSNGMRIPSMPPGTLQFLLANSTPEREALFLSQIGTTNETRILFHGTSPDRLFAILCQSLKILSATPLQTHGAAYGKGIYLADEPATSFTYCTSPLLPYKNWKNSELGKGENKGYKLLLGVEQAGPRVVSGDNQIHVVKEEKTLMVRYIFLVPNSVVTVPVARHLVPAMGSVVKGLRSGSLGRDFE